MLKTSSIYPTILHPQKVLHAIQNKDHCIIGADPKEICAKADYTITNITNTATVKDLFVNQGFFDICNPNGYILDTSTIEPLGKFLPF